MIYKHFLLRTAFLIVLGSIALFWTTACGDKQAQTKNSSEVQSSDAGTDGDTNNASSDNMDASMKRQLAVDCTDKFTGVCADPSDLEPGSYGNGIALSLLPGVAEIHRGFANADTAFVGVEYGTYKGFIMAVDLETGDRSIVSGTYEDPAIGEQVVGEGPELGAVLEVHAQGKLYTYSNRSDGAAIFEVDPVSGDRTLLWLSDNTSYGRCTTTVLGEEDRTVHPGLSMAVDAEHNFYLAFDNNPGTSGYGIMKISSDGQSCEFFTRHGGPEGTDVGSGLELSGRNLGLTFQGENLYALNSLHQALMQYDPQGSRTAISREGVGKGPEPGARFLAWSDFDNLWWTGGDFVGDLRALISVDPENGDRVEHVYKSGPFPPATEGDIIAIDGGLILQVANDDALVLVDPSTGNSNVLSY